MDELSIVRTNSTNYGMETYVGGAYTALGKIDSGFTNTTQLYTNDTTGAIQYTATGGTARASLVECINT